MNLGRAPPPRALSSQTDTRLGGMGVRGWDSGGVSQEMRLAKERYIITELYDNDNDHDVTNELRPLTGGTAVTPPFGRHSVSPHMPT
ncbi:hypothetical protein CSOJ01_15391 [Colletotrichum sojae]|uniref:Uncharacterized protein n=1 Tax=Colletotrichum sojae TaxID=2175907 RepID=A0A8H6MI67_9PEZI|nr:hypothetical protein CSOJ01_15391 [Colletotrichum sojae]